MLSTGALAVLLAFSATLSTVAASQELTEVQQQLLNRLQAETSSRTGSRRTLSGVPVLPLFGSPNDPSIDVFNYPWAATMKGSLDQLLRASGCMNELSNSCLITHGRTQQSQSRPPHAMT